MYLMELVVFVAKREFILSAGIEPATLGLLDPRSNQLSYESMTSLLYCRYKIMPLTLCKSCHDKYLQYRYLQD